MSNEEEHTEEPDDSSENENTEADESSVPLSQYEKIKDDYLRLAADFDIIKKDLKKRKKILAQPLLRIL